MVLEGGEKALHQLTVPNTILTESVLHNGGAERLATDLEI